MEQWETPDGRTATYDVEDGGWVRVSVDGGWVRVSVELLRQMLADLGLTRKEDA